jgi:hypothetical protein
VVIWEETWLQLFMKKKSWQERKGSCASEVYHWILFLGLKRQMRGISCPLETFAQLGDQSCKTDCLCYFCIKPSKSLVPPLEPGRYLFMV